MTFKALLLTGMLLASSAQAAIVTFDDIVLTPTSQGGVGDVPAAYRAVAWNGWGAMDATYFSTYGNTYSFASLNNGVFNDGGKDVSISAFPGTKISLLSGKFASLASGNGFTPMSSSSLTIEAYEGDTLLDSRTFALTATGFRTLNTFLFGADRIVFKHDGVADARYWTADNLDISVLVTPTPEPASMAVIGLGLAVMRRRRGSK